MEPTETRTAGTPAPAPDPSRTAQLGPNAVLGRYRVLEKLGSGGMGDVWIGRATGEGAFERLVAIKTVHPSQRDDDAARAKFLREASLAATIRHANVVDVFDVGDEGGVLYQVMSLVEGESLATLIERASAKLPFELTAGVVGDALRGLHAAHESVDERGRARELIHRDVSPQNILVGLDGVARIADFGIAKAQAVHDETTGTLKGKVGYFAPEQAEQSTLDRRTDIFAMGVVLWECLAGRRLFKGASMIETLRNVASMPIRPAHELNPAVPEPLSCVAARALEREPSRRFPTALAMAEALREACRLSGLEPSSERTARVVDDLVGEEVRQRTGRALALASTATRAPSAPLDETLPEASAPPARSARSGSRARWRPALVGAIALVATAGAVGVVVVARARDDARGGSDRSSEPSTAVREDDRATPIERSAGAPDASPSTSAQREPGPSASAHEERRRRGGGHATKTSRTPPVSTNPFR